MKNMKNKIGYLLLTLLFTLSIISFVQETRYKKIVDVEEKEIPLEDWMLDPSSWGIKTTK